MAENREILVELIHLIDKVEKINDLNDLLKHLETNRFQDRSLDRRSLLNILENPAFLQKVVDKLFSVVILKGWAKSTSLSWNLLYKFMIQENEEQALIFLTNLFEIESRHRIKRNSEFDFLASEALKYFLENNTLIDLFWKQCLIKPTQVNKDKYHYAPSVQHQWDSIIKKIISSPDIIANRMTFDTNSVFLPQTYFTILGQSICDVLQRIHDSIQNSKDCSLHFLTRLFGKLCYRGYAEIAYDVLLPKFKVWIKESPLWRRICSKFLVTVADSHLEAVLEPLLKRYESLDIFNHLMGSIDFKTHGKLKFLIKNKALFLKAYSNELTPYLVLDYMKSYQEDFKEVLFKLLKVWGDHSSMQTTSFERHEYLTKCILIAISLLTPKQKVDWKEELIMKLLESVQPHMESPNEKIRELGMIVAEMLTSALDTNGKQLNFELEKTEEIETLYELARNPLHVIRVKQSTEEKHSLKLHQTPSHSKTSKRKEEKEIEEENKTKTEDKNEELDSDDEFEPINIRNGREEEENVGSVNGVQPPLYLRDCISGLLSSKDPDRLEACLNALNKLVKREPGDLKDLTVELLTILLHLEDEYNITNFYATKHEATLTIVCKCPRMASEFLCQQFFEENFTINQRLDILEIISSSATRLAKPDYDNFESHRKQLPRPRLQQYAKNSKVQDEKPEWKAIVDERVQKKTRRFNSGNRKEIEAKENRLSTVIGSFFFPLMKKFGIDSQASQLLSSESMLLGKYIYTLAVVLQAAQDLPAITPMSKTLLELIWTLRYHREAFVRQSLIFALSRIILTVPIFILMSDIQLEMMEARSWLEGVVENDPDQECRKMAASSIIVLQKTLEKEFIGGN